MKSYWVWLGLLFLLASCSQTNAPGELNTQTITRYVSLSPLQAKPGDLITATIYDIDPAQIMYAHVTVGDKSAPLVASPLTGAMKFEVPASLDADWHDVTVGVVGSDTYGDGYRGSYEYYEYIGYLKVMPPPHPNDPIGGNHDVDGHDPSDPEPEPLPYP